MPEDITSRKKNAGLWTEVVLCYMSDRQERFGLLLFSNNGTERGHPPPTPETGSIVLIDL